MTIRLSNWLRFIHYITSGIARRMSLFLVTQCSPTQVFCFTGDSCTQVFRYLCSNLLYLSGEQEAIRFPIKISMQEFNKCLRLKEFKQTTKL